MKLSICTTVKNRSWIELDRAVLRLFPTFVQSIMASTNDGDEVELVVADWQSTDHELQEWLWAATRPIKTQIVTVNEPDFSRGRGLNLAADAATHDTIFFLDADMILTRQLLLDACRIVAQNKAFFPICFYPLDQAGERGVWAKEGYGNVAVSRAMFTWCRWPEAFRWGGQDSVFYRRLRELVPVARKEHEGFQHQWHPMGPGWRDRYARGGGVLVLGIAPDRLDCDRLTTLLEDVGVTATCGMGGQEDPTAEVPTWGTEFPEYTLQMREVWVREGKAVADVGRYWLNYVDRLFMYIDTPSKVVCVVRDDSDPVYLARILAHERKYGSRLLVCAVSDENWHLDASIQLGVKTFLSPIRD